MTASIYKGKCVRGRETEIIDCAACGFKHVWPLPTEEETEKYYECRYFSKEKPDYATTSGSGSDYQLAVDSEKLEVVRPLLAGLTYRGLLDFGCGPTAPFVRNWIKVLGPDFDFAGVEPSKPKGADYPAGMKVGQTLADMAGKVFGVVNLSFVLEHLVWPREYLERLAMRLEPGGLLILESPNDFSVLQMELWKRLGGAPWWVSTPDHLNYLDAGGAQGLLGHTGFRVLRCGTTYPVELFLAQGQDYRTDPKARKLVVSKRLGLQQLWRASGLNRQTQVGRTFWVVAQKTEGKP